jgi:hypothetical protein
VLALCGLSAATRKTGGLQNPSKSPYYPAVKIDEFIAKHTLTLFQSFPENGPSVVEAIPKNTPTALLPENKNDHYSIYTNADQTLWVSKNTSRSLFLMQQRETSGAVIFASVWLDANTDHKIL